MLKNGKSAEFQQSPAALHQVEILLYQYTKNIRAQEEKREDEIIFDNYLSCFTEDEIALKLGWIDNDGKLKQQVLHARLEKVLQKMHENAKLVKLSLFDDETIFEMYLACYTEDEIAGKIGISRDLVHDRIPLLCKSFPGTIGTKLSQYDDDTFQIPLYTAWTQKQFSTMRLQPLYAAYLHSFTTLLLGTN